LPSTAQVETLPDVAQNEPAPPAQSGGEGSQVQVPFGLAPVQLWCEGQATVLAT
jgi:hypothetical protein